MLARGDQTLVRAFPATAARPVALLRGARGSATVELFGEIDLLTAVGFASAVRAVAPTGMTLDVIDLTAVSFFDCAGVNVLAEALRSYPGLTVVGARPLTKTVLHLTGVHPLFADRYPLAEAVLTP